MSIIVSAHFVPLEKDKIAFGLTAIKNVGLGAIRSIIDHREKLNQYENIFQMMQNVDLRLVNKKVIESLVQAGALDSLEGNRAQNFHVIESAIEFGQDFQSRKNRHLGQKTLFDLQPDGSDNTVTYPRLPEVQDWSPQEKLIREKEFLGFYITGHPLEKYANIIKLYSTNFDSVNGKLNGGQNMITVCGMITDMRTLMDKKQNMMAFVKIEDFRRTYEAVVFGSVFPQVEKILRPDAMVLMKGRLNGALDESVVKLICEDVYELKDVPGKMTEAIILNIDKAKLKPDDITYLKNTLFSHKGSVPVYFRVAVNGKEEVNMVSKKVKISVNGSLLNELEKIITLENMKVKVRLA